MNDEEHRGSINGRRILIVEDEWFIVTELIEFLTANGAVVVGPVSSLSDGLELATATDLFDGAILNISLHDKYSYPIADVFLEHGIPFAFATGIDHYAIPPAYARVPHISKPYEAATVMRALFRRSDLQRVDL